MSLSSAASGKVASDWMKYKVTWHCCCHWFFPPGVRYGWNLNWNLCPAISRRQSCTNAQSSGTTLITNVIVKSFINLVQLTWSEKMSGFWMSLFFFPLHDLNSDSTREVSPRSLIAASMYCWVIITHRGRVCVCVCLCLSASVCVCVPVVQRCPFAQQ